MLSLVIVNELVNHWTACRLPCIFLLCVNKSLFLICLIIFWNGDMQYILNLFPLGMRSVSYAIFFKSSFYIIKFTDSIICFDLFWTLKKRSVFIYTNLRKCHMLPVNCTEVIVEVLSYIGASITSRMCLKNFIWRLNDKF